MRLTDIIQPKCIKVPLAATTKQDAVFEMVDLLADQAGITSRDELRNTVWQREQTRTTGIGHGVAIPHGKCSCVKKLHMAIGKTTTPIDFAAIDGKPVDLIILLASPIDQSGPHIQALASISRMLTAPSVRAAIKATTDSQSLYQLIADFDAKSP